MSASHNFEYHVVITHSLYPFDNYLLIVCRKHGALGISVNGFPFLELWYESNPCKMLFLL